MSQHQQAKIVSIAGCAMHNLSMIETIELIASRLDSGVFTQHAVINVAKLVSMQSDKELKRSVADCDIVNIDGMGVVWGARFLGCDISERVAGIDLFHELISMSAKKGFSVYLLGATDDVVTAAANKIQATYSDIKIAGYHHGYFWDDEPGMVDRIRASGAQLLFVAISSPQKENFINRWKEQLGVKFVMGVGGTFDVVAGKVKRAPVWMQKAGLEWLFRVIQEPRRMWRRYLVTNSRFAWLLLREKTRQLFNK